MRIRKRIHYIITKNDQLEAMSSTKFRNISRYHLKNG